MLTAIVGSDQIVAFLVLSFSEVVVKFGMDAFWIVGVGFLSGILSEKFVNVKMLGGENLFVTSVFGVV